MGTGTAGKKRKKVTLDAWVDRQLHEAMLWAGGGLILGLFVAGFLTLLYWNMIWIVLIIGFQWAIAPGWFSEATTLVFCLLAVLYLTVNWESLERLRFESTDTLHSMRLASRLVGSPFLAIAGPQTAISTLKVLLMILLIGPASWHLVILMIQRLRIIQTTDRERLTAAIKRLLESERRISISAALGVDSPRDVRQALAELGLIYGINFIEAPPAGLVMSDSLKDEIIASCKSGSKESSKLKSGK